MERSNTATRMEVVMNYQELKQIIQDTVKKIEGETPEQYQERVLATKAIMIYLQNANKNDLALTTIAAKLASDEIVIKLIEAALATKYIDPINKKLDPHFTNDLEKLITDKIENIKKTISNSIPNSTLTSETLDGRIVEIKQAIQTANAKQLRQILSRTVAGLGESVAKLAKPVALAEALITEKEAYQTDMKVFNSLNSALNSSFEAKKELHARENTNTTKVGMAALGLGIASIIAGAACAATGVGIPIALGLIGGGIALITGTIALKGIVDFFSSKKSTSTTDQVKTKATTEASTPTRTTSESFGSQQSVEANARRTSSTSFVSTDSTKSTNSASEKRTGKSSTSFFDRFSSPISLYEDIKSCYFLNKEKQAVRDSQSQTKIQGLLDKAKDQDLLAALKHANAQLEKAPDDELVKAAARRLNDAARSRKLEKPSSPLPVAASPTLS